MILRQWDLIEVDFQSEYGIDLEDMLHVKSWRWFVVRVAGLSAQSRLWRFFTPESEES